jgi:adenylate kinase family enzyme
MMTIITGGRGSGKTRLAARLLKKFKFIEVERCSEYKLTPDIETIYVTGIDNEKTLMNWVHKIGTAFEYNKKNKPAIMLDFPEVIIELQDESIIPDSLYIRTGIMVIRCKSWSL